MKDKNGWKNGIVHLHVFFAFVLFFRVACVFPFFQARSKKKKTKKSKSKTQKKKTKKNEKKNNKCKWTIPFFPLVFPFLTFLFFPIYFVSCFFQFWSFIFYFSICFLLFSSLKIIRINYKGEHKAMTHHVPMQLQATNSDDRPAA